MKISIRQLRQIIHETVNSSQNDGNIKLMEENKPRIKLSSLKRVPRAKGQRIVAHDTDILDVDPQLKADAFFVDDAGELYTLVPPNAAWARDETELWHRIKDGDYDNYYYEKVEFEQ